MLSAGAFALELDTAEELADVSADESAVQTELAELSTERTDIGVLIYSADFEDLSEKIGQNVNESYVGEGLTVRMTNGGDSNYKVTAVEAGENNTAISITHTGGHYPQVVFYFTNDTKYGAGEYTIVYDVYVPEGKTGANVNTWFPYNDTHTNHGTPKNGKWYTYSKTVTLDGVPHSAGVHLNYTEKYDTDCLYIDNYRIYYSDPALKTGKPGLNILTGTTEPIGFEQGASAGVYFYAGGVSGGTVYDNSVDSLGEGNTTNIIRIDNLTAPYCEFHFPGVFEANRRYEIKYDSFFSLIRDKNLPAWFYDYKKYDSHADWTSVIQKQMDNGKDKWYSFKSDFDTTDTNAKRGNVYIQNKVITNDKEKAPAYSVGLDNISVIPHYKITYMSADGETPDTIDWYLRDSKGNFATAYAPSPNVNPVWNGDGNKAVIGWSTEGVNGAVVDKVQLANEDIVFYPVYADAETYVRGSKALNAGEGTSGGVFFTKTVDSTKTTIDFGKTGATAKFSAKENRYTVTAAGYAGEIIFNLTFADGTTATEKVYLYSGNKWLPGLNTFTGTTEPMDFEQITATDLSKVIQNSTWYNVTTEDDGNTHIYTTGKYAYAFGAKDFTTRIELERKVAYSLDVNSNSGAFILVNTSGADGLIYRPTSTDGWQTRVYTFALKENLDQCTDKVKGTGLFKVGYGADDGKYGLKGEEGKEYMYLDNMSLIPYYMITYVDVDGTKTVDQVLFDEDGNVLTKYTPKAEMFGSGVEYYSLTADGKNPVSFEEAKEIALENKDITLYAVVDLDTEKQVGFKFITKNGTKNGAIRFTSTISFADKAAADEYGFLATRQVLLDAMAEKASKETDEEVKKTIVTDLTFDFKDGDKALYVAEKAYEKGTDLDKMSGQTDDGVIFNAAVIGIKATDKGQVNEKIVVRPYVKFVNGETTYTFYGEKSSASLVEAAEKADTANLTEEEKADVDAIIALKNA